MTFFMAFAEGGAFVRCHLPYSKRPRCLVKSVNQQGIILFKDGSCYDPYTTKPNKWRHKGRKNYYKKLYKELAKKIYKVVERNGTWIDA
jgi:hypothetical protein